MKKIRTIFSLLSLSLLAISCGLDNYDEPESFLEGKITYKGKQLGLKGYKRRYSTTIVSGWLCQP